MAFTRSAMRAGGLAGSRAGVLVSTPLRTLHVFVIRQSCNAGCVGQIWKPRGRPRHVNTPGRRMDHRLRRSRRGQRWSVWTLAAFR